MSSREQLFNTIASDLCDDTKLGKMGTDRIITAVCWRIKR